jgi:ABC-type lipoprotein release transport system permease subunit
MAVVAAIVATVIAAVLPARRAAKLNPVDVMR